MSFLAPLPFALPLLAAAVLTGGAPLFRRRSADLFSIAVALSVTIICGVLLGQTQHTPVIHWFGGWRPHQGFSLGIAFVVDPLGAGLATLAATLVTLSLVYSFQYFDESGTLFPALMLVFLGAMTGFCLTGDLFNLFVCFELMSVAAYALTGYKVEDKTTLEGSLNFAVTNSVGGFLVLMGIALLYARTGALNFAQAGQALTGHAADGLVITSFALIAGGFLVKAAIVPFHFWLADAHAVAPTPVCVLFSGVMVELGLFGAARVYASVFSGALAGHEPALRGLLLGAAALTTLVGGVMCFLQRHIKRLLAFSTISHMGMLLGGFALLDARALAGTALYGLAHGLVKAALFFCAGILLDRFGSVDEMELRGKGRGLRWSGPMVLLGALGLAGLPPFLTADGKAILDEATRALGHTWLSVVFVLGSALTGGAVIRVAGRIYLGLGPEPGEEASAAPGKDDKETHSGPGGPPWVMILPAAALLLAALALGRLPGLEAGAYHAAQRFLDRPAYAAATLALTAPAPTASPPPLPHRPEDTLLALATVALAFVFAGLALNCDKLPRALHKGCGSLSQPIINALRAWHSGDVRDYVTWLVVGIAAGGALLALRLH